MFQKQDSNVLVLKHSWIKERKLWELYTKVFNTAEAAVVILHCGVVQKLKNDEAQ